MGLTESGKTFGWGWAAVGQLGRPQPASDPLCFQAAIPAAMLHTVVGVKGRAVTGANFHDVNAADNGGPHGREAQQHGVHVFRSRSDSTGSVAVLLSEQHEVLPCGTQIDFDCAFGASCHSRQQLTHDSLEAMVEGEAPENDMGPAASPAAFVHEQHGLCAQLPMEVVLMLVNKPLGDDAAEAQGLPACAKCVAVRAADWHTACLLADVNGAEQ